MAYLNVDTSSTNYGNAPTSAVIGDVIHTAGGDYQIVSEGTPGAKYNESSGRYSIKLNPQNPTSPTGNSGRTEDDYIGAGMDTQDNLNTQMSDAAALANAISAWSSAMSYNFNREEAQKTRDWQEYMSNTAHQREVYDLMMAGLNPVLSAKLGGSSTPAGATAQGQAFTGQKADVDTSIMPYMSSIIGSMLGFTSQMNVAKINQDTALQTAAISSAASMYGADKSSAASMYAALKNYEGLKYSTDNGKNPLFNAGNDIYNWLKDTFGHSNNSPSGNPKDFFDKAKDIAKFLFPSAF